MTHPSPAAPAARSTPRSAGRHRDSLLPTQVRAKETRCRLIDAAVLSLNRHGFGGTTMLTVAKLAGVSTGPRQYHFPTKEDLFEAVVDHLIKGQNVNYAVLSNARTALEWFETVIERSLAYLGTPDHVAMLEIKLALKHEPELRARVQGKLLALEVQNDRGWATGPGAAGRSADEMFALRRLFAAMMRGLALDADLDGGEKARALIVKTRALIEPLLVSVALPAPTTDLEL